MQSIDGVQCRICLETVSKTEMYNCTKCACSGTMIDIHDECLFHWIYRNADQKYQTSCETCKQAYIFSRYMKIRISLKEREKFEVVQRKNLIQEIRNRNNRHITEEDIARAIQKTQEYKKSACYGFLVIIVISVIVGAILSWFASDFYKRIIFLLLLLFNIQTFTLATSIVLFNYNIWIDVMTYFFIGLVKMASFKPNLSVDDVDIIGMISSVLLLTMDVGIIVMFAFLLV